MAPEVYPKPGIGVFLPFIEENTSKAELISLTAICFASLYQQERNTQIP